MIETLHPLFASVAMAGALRMYLRELSGCGLNARVVRIPLLVALVSGVGLSRVAFAIERGLPWSETARPAPGGYVLYGALPALVLFTLWLRAHGIAPRPYVDRLAPYVLLALAPARVGCWIVGCCVGITLDSGTAVPAPLLAAGWNTLLAILLLRRNRLDSLGSAPLALAGHALGRALLDPLRQRSVTQGGVALGLVLWGLLRYQAARARESRC